MNFDDENITGLLSGFDPDQVVGSDDPSKLNDAFDRMMKIMNAIKDGMKTINIIVAGKTGVGKSTLINAVFRRPVAKEGIGEPVTKSIDVHYLEGFPLKVYDTRGLELDQNAQAEAIAEIKETIRRGALSANIEDHIQCVWYCINTASNRIEDEEIKFLRELSDASNGVSVPVIVVLTQAVFEYNAEKMRSTILEKNLNIRQVVPVLAKPFKIHNITIPAYGLDILVDITAQLLPDELEYEFQYIQNASLKGKVDLAKKILGWAMVISGLVGGKKLPFKDAFVLLPLQIITMWVITYMFGFDNIWKIIGSFLTSLVGAGLATMTGRAIVNKLLEVIPGFSGMISATTASALTVALGEAYIQLMIAFYKGEIKASDLDTEEGKEKIREFVQESVKEH